jgi:lysophospholipase L1-like esterase
LAFGDSLTFGKGTTLEESYPSQLAAITKLKVINAGQNGRTSAEGLALLPDLLEETQPDLVLLCLGGNDFLRKIPTEQTENNLRQMLTLLQAKKIPVVLIAVPELDLFLRPSPIYKNLAQTYQVPLDLKTLSELEIQSDKKSDHIHFNAAGYRVMAESVANLLKETGALPK